MERVGLVGCVKSKQPVPMSAKDLYTSALFRGRRAYVERTCDRWFVLSAKHGLLEPEEVIEPYDVRLADASIAVQRRWSETVVDELSRRLGSVRDLTFEIHASSAYRDSGVVSGLQARGATVISPVDGLNRGQQLAFYTRAQASPSNAQAAPHPGPPSLVPAASQPTAHTSAPAAPAPKRRRRGQRWRAEPPVWPPLPPPSSEPSAVVEISEVVPLGEFDYRWPDGTEHFERGWDFTATSEGMGWRLRHALGSRHVFGSDRVHSVTWLSGAPVVEGAAADDHPTTRALVSVLKRPDRKDVRSLEELPSGYESFDVVVHNAAIRGPNARRSLAVKVREDDLATWAHHAILRFRARSEQSSRSSIAVSKSTTPAEPPALSPLDDRHDVVDRLLAFGAELAARPGGETPTFTPDPAANEFLMRDAFAFLVAVICDQGIRAERAWAAPYLLRQRLGHWDLSRLAAEREAVVRAFRERPALHRMVEITPERVSAAAQRVLQQYDGDAAQIWSDRPSADLLQRRLEAFEGIGQKKSAMAVEILERDLGVPLAEMAGSDIAYDVHVRRVFLRTGLAARDDVGHMVDVARALHVDRPGALDFPAWDVGRRWCRPVAPRCDQCVLGGVCPRLVSRGDGIKGM